MRAARIARGRWQIGALIGLATVAVALPATAARGAAAAHFTRGTATAKQFGTHEIVLRGNGAAANPFDTVATVRFTSPSGRSVRVHAFYDGGDTWRARLYVDEVGVWRWRSASRHDAGLHGQSGAFVAVDAPLPGMLRQHRHNPKQWMTDDGRGFIHLSDTAYKLFDGEEPLWREYVRDLAALGITAVRALALGDWDWGRYWQDGERRRLRLSTFQTTDARLQWLLDHYPHLYIQLILFPDGEPYGSDDTFWTTLPATVRRRTMRYMLARWAAFPQLFWLVTNDTAAGEDRPRNRAWAREVGRYFRANDPWRHLISFGPVRRQAFPFTTRADLGWAGYIHLQTAYALAADETRAYAAVPLHVFCGEDYYEHDPRSADLRPAHPRYFYRRLFWAWLLSGGSPNYGGRFGVIHPYTQTASLTWASDGRRIAGQLVGLDSIRHIQPYFAARRIELWRFRPDDAAVRDVRAGDAASSAAARPDRPKAARRGHEEYLIYHPNASPGERAGDEPAAEESRRNAALDRENTPAVRVDLRGSARRFRVEWFRAADGVAHDGGTVRGGGYRSFVAPWRGYDVVLRLVAADGR
jgi:hypothetical protein